MGSTRTGRASVRSRNTNGVTGGHTWQHVARGPDHPACNRWRRRTTAHANQTNAPASTKAPAQTRSRLSQALRRTFSPTTS